MCVYTSCGCSMWWFGRFKILRSRVVCWLCCPTLPCHKNRMLLVRCKKISCVSMQVKFGCGLFRPRPRNGRPDSRSEANSPRRVASHGASSLHNCPDRKIVSDRDVLHMTKGLKEINAYINMHKYEYATTGWRVKALSLHFLRLFVRFTLHPMYVHQRASTFCKSPLRFSLSL